MTDNRMIMAFRSSVLPSLTNWFKPINDAILNRRPIEVFNRGRM